MIRRPPRSTLFPHPPPSDLPEDLARSHDGKRERAAQPGLQGRGGPAEALLRTYVREDERFGARLQPDHRCPARDPQSTRLNSSHANITDTRLYSYKK